MEIFSKIFSSILVVALVLSCSPGKSVSASEYWKASLLREDGKRIDFILEAGKNAEKDSFFVINGEERLLVDSIVQKGDSLVIVMPFFDSEFRVHKQDSILSGVWIRDLGNRFLTMPFVARKNISERFRSTAAPKYTISGRWATNFIKPDQREVAAFGEFQQINEKLTGTFILPSGDYRYLEGIVNGDTMRLSTFDGNHAYFFEALIENDSTIREGYFYSGATAVERWSAVKNDQLQPENITVTNMRPGESRLDFSFRSTTGEQVSINDSRFRGKVVLVQIMGSWCPNCMDESKFLSDFYKKNRDRGLEVIALAYERTTDFEKSAASLKSFQTRFDIEYPVLITGVAVSDSLRTEKTLPQLTEIKYFPSLIFIDRKGIVRRLHTGFQGPGTGLHYENFIQEFEAEVNRLLNEE